MSETVGVVIATFGDPKWQRMAQTAIESVEAQTHPADDVVMVHGETLAEARNAGGDSLSTDWLIFLDADDELDPGYIAAMLNGTGQVRRPSTLGVVDGVEDDAPVLIPEADLLSRNYIVIGAMVRRSLFNLVEGFRELPVLEDWDFWIRCWLAGAVITAVPEAIYRVTVRSDSRNQDAGIHGRIYREIRREYADRRPLQVL